MIFRILAIALLVGCGTAPDVGGCIEFVERYGELSCATDVDPSFCEEPPDCMCRWEGFFDSCSASCEPDAVVSCGYLECFECPEMSDFLDRMVDGVGAHFE